ncbi:hypothetical protein ACVH9Z_36550 [Rhodococcus opacus]
MLFFFLDLGSRLEFSHAADQIPDALIFSLFVPIGIVVVIMAVMRLPRPRRISDLDLAYPLLDERTLPAEASASRQRSRPPSSSMW